MTTLTIRKKLMTYLADADDSKVKAIYTLLKDDMQEANSHKLTNEQLEILEEEHQLHINGQSKSYTRSEAAQIIKGQRSF
ncbi:MAG: hypothetical protein ACXVAY_07740 [Mucilaginibacter sp.]